MYCDEAALCHYSLKKGMWVFLILEINLDQLFLNDYHSNEYGVGFLNHWMSYDPNIPIGYGLSLNKLKYLYLNNIRFGLFTKLTYRLLPS